MKRLPVLMVLLMAFCLALILAACGGDEETPPATTGDTTPTTTSEPKEDVVITIGNLTDITGPAASAMEVINQSLVDLVDYFNEENLIPGAVIKIINYDGQFDPSRDIPGYEWLKEKGADLIFTAVPGTPVTLKSRADRDHVVVFGVSGDLSELSSPPGYVFNLGTVPRHEGLTLLKWLAENHWDWQTKGPAKIGGAGWDEAYTGWWLDAMKDYAAAHPDQFEWAGGYLTRLGTFTWQTEIDALKDCDYVFVPTVMTNFVKDYRDAGYDGHFIGTYTHAAFFGQLTDAGLWDEIEGMLFMASSRWWNEEGEIIDLTRELLYENHPEEAEDIIDSGVGYITIVNLYQMLSIIRDAVEAVGPGDFDSEALYDAAKSYTLTIDGWDRYSFSETKRWATDLYAVYEADPEGKTVVRLHEKWLPVVIEP